jgi:GxxExxY protein
MTTDKKNFKYKDLTEKVIKGFYEVYNELGAGFLESVYENALAIVLKDHSLQVEQQYPIPVKFRGKIIGDFKADILVDDKVIVELKAVKRIIDAHKSQIINYLKASDIEVGLLLNFGLKPEVKRFIYN